MSHLVRDAGVPPVLANHPTNMRALLISLLCIALTAHGQTKSVASSPVFKPGAETELGVPAGGGKAVGLWTSFPSEVTPTGGGFRVRVPSTMPADVGAVRVFTASGGASLQWVMIDDLPTAPPPADGRLSIPCAVEGTTSALGVTSYRFEGRKGQRVAVEVVANRLGSRLDPVVRLLDASGRELAYADDTPAIAPDCRLACTLPADGEYRVELRDVNYDGGSEYRYRLRVGDFAFAEPAFPHAPGDVVAKAFPTKLELPANVSGRFTAAGERHVYAFEGKAAERVSLRARARSIGSAAAPVVSLLGPGGGAVAEVKQPGKKVAANVPNLPPTATDWDPIEYALPSDGTYSLVVQDANRYGADHVYRLEMERSPSFELAVDADSVAATPGEKVKIGVTCTRRKFGGPVALRLEGEHLDGVKLLTAALGSGQTEGTIEIQLAADAKPTTFRIVGTAKIDGREVSHPASTIMALRKGFPRLMYPPEEVDGVIGLGVKKE